METKLCPRCKETLSLESFSRNASKASGRQPYCITCMRAYRREHYQNNKSDYGARSRAQEAVLKDISRKAREIPCADCGIQYPYYVMDFDHLDPSIKVANLASMVKQGNKQALLDEIEKCEVVCANCHRIRTHS